MSEKPAILKVIIGDSPLVLLQVSDLFSYMPGVSYELSTLKPPFRIFHERSLFSTLKDIVTRELDRAILQHKADIAIYPATDLPYPIPVGMEVIALVNKDLKSETKGQAAPVDGEFDSVVPEIEPLAGCLAVVAGSGREDLKAFFASLNILKTFGKVTLVGFGPGNPDLLTLGGDKALSDADCIFHDDLVDKDFLQKYRAEKVYVGKRKARHSVSQEEINKLLLLAAMAGKKVVRLKGGDPMVFAHGGEEIEYLQRNLVEVLVIPGVSAGFAASACSKVPLTHRNISSSVAFISGHSESVFLPNTDTLVIYMGGSLIRKIAARAIREGRHPDTPVLLVYNVSLPDQAEFFFTLRELCQSEEKFPTPVIIVVGEVVSLRLRPAAETVKSFSRKQKQQNGTVFFAGKRDVPASGYPINLISMLNLDQVYNGLN